MTQAIESSPVPLKAKTFDNVEKNEEKLSNEDIFKLCLNGNISVKDLNSLIHDPLQVVELRRELLRTQCCSENISTSFYQSLPYKGFDYGRVLGACCENVIGYLTVPLGIAGPLIVDQKPTFLPIATTEGALVASISRGSKVINESGGVKTVLMGDSMTRAPCVKFPTLARSIDAKVWIESPEGRSAIEKGLSDTSKFASLKNIRAFPVGELLYLRLSAATGDAMGMNMISLAAEKMLSVLKNAGFDDMTTITLSGNLCSDKKASAINWIEGRGKSVAAQARISRDLVEKKLKTTPQYLIELNTSKNLIGSAISGAIGGFNAHASNIVSAIFLATGQDIAQNVESSNCITTMSL